MANLKQLLLQLNLSEKEVRLFLALVRLGKATATAIGREAGLTRTHVYDLIEGLVAKGLVSEVEERSIKTYEAVDHAGLVAFISREQNKFAGLEKQVGQLAGEFNALQVGKQQKTKVRFFDGLEGVKNIYEEIQRDLKKQAAPFELITIFSPQNLQGVMPDFSYLNYPLMNKRDIVCADSMLDAYLKKMHDSTHERTYAYKIWPDKRGLFPTDNICWPGKLTFIDLQGFPSGIIIENSAMIQTFTMWFNQIWESLPRTLAD